MTPGYYVDWNVLEERVVSRIRLLRACHDKLECDSEIREKLMEDVIVPCITLLVSFCEAVSIEDNERAEA